MLNIHTKRLQNSDADVRGLVKDIISETVYSEHRQSWDNILDECELRQYSRREIAIVYRNVERYIY